jgi:hypothetical protein
MFTWMRSCGCLNGIMPTAPRSSFEQTEFQNHLDCRIRRCRNLRPKPPFRRSDLIQLFQSNPTFHIVSQRRSYRRSEYRFCPIEDGIAYWPMEIERTSASISNVASQFI